MGSFSWIELTPRSRKRAEHDGRSVQKKSRNPDAVTSPKVHARDGTHTADVAGEVDRLPGRPVGSNGTREVVRKSLCAEASRS